VLSSAKDEQTEQCDATASPKNESPSETGDSDADPNYSVSDTSYNSFSYDDVNVSALSESQPADATTGEKTGSRRGEK
jgi:hypothetical protein